MSVRRRPRTSIRRSGAPDSWATMREMNDRPAQPTSHGHGIVDVQQIVDDLQTRVEQRRLGQRAGFWSFGRDKTEVRSGRVVLRPEMAASGKRGVGAALTAVKKLDLRLNWQFLTDLVGQINAALEVQRTATAAEARRRAELERRVIDLEQQIKQIAAQFAADSDPADASGDRQTPDPQGPARFAG